MPMAMAKKMERTVAEVEVPMAMAKKMQASWILGRLRDTPLSLIHEHRGR